MQRTLFFPRPRFLTPISISTLPPPPQFRTHATKRTPSEYSEEDLTAARKWLSNLNPDTIPRNLCEITFSRSSGPGGQNVNKYVLTSPPKPPSNQSLTVPSTQSLLKSHPPPAHPRSPPPPPSNPSRPPPLLPLPRAQNFLPHNPSGRRAQASRQRECLFSEITRFVAGDWSAGRPE